MEFLLLDLTAHFLFAVKWLLFVLAFILLILGIDDLIIDILYWTRRCYRRFFLYSKNPAADESLLFSVSEQPLAVMIPAWNEVGVIGKMAELAATSIEYENYQIFVGTYPNDPDTQRDVDEILSRYSNVHKVVCARPGPTSKADCLNNVIDAIFSFEQASGVRFAGFIMHDAEDVISPLELRLFNYLLPRKDLIQVPVYPFVPEWYEFTSGHYIDEFAEQHAKDVIVREAMVHQVPSAGVGTCFSRRAVLSLLEEGEGIAFDIQSLTEDYDIGYRLKQRNASMEEIFARFYVKNPKYATLRESGLGISSDQRGVICVRGFFPRTFGQSVRQKSRWITGIVFQGIVNLGWSRSFVQNYFLWRDRRGVITNFVGFLANITFLIVVVVLLINWLFPQSWQFPPLLQGDQLFVAVLSANVLLLSNRLFQRFFFVCTYYGVWQGLLSAPRTLWGNVINFFATWRALVNVLRAGDARRVAWDKTQHEMPALDEPNRTPIGQYLVEQGALDQQQLEKVLQKGRRLKLGRSLMMAMLITPQQLGRALAAQNGFDYSEVHPLALDRETVDAFPRKVALRYGVVPLKRQDGVLLLGVEKSISPVALGAISRQIESEVRPVMLPSGFSTLALRYWYGRPDLREADPVLKRLIERPDDMELASAVARYQVLLGDLIEEMGMISPQVFAQALFDYNPLKQSIGRFMLDRGLISEELLEKAVTVQRDYQQRANDLAARFETSDSQAAFTENEAGEHP